MSERSPAGPSRIRLPFALAAAIAMPLAVPLSTPVPPLSPVPMAFPSARPRPTATPTPVPGEVRVSVSLGDAAKKVAAAGAVVWIPARARRCPPEHGRIASKGKRFDPRIAAVPVGATVDFPNLDKIHHNVFSLSERARFDLGLYKNGASKPVTFPNAGLVRIYCNIHPQMAAYLMVVDGRTYAQTAADGLAVLAGVAPGRHPLKVWDEKGGEWAGTVEVLSGKTTPVSVLLDAVGYHEVAHTRKDGTKYPPPQDDDNRY